MKFVHNYSLGGKQDVTYNVIPIVGNMEKYGG
jgi:hypothetical protein